MDNGSITLRELCTELNISRRAVQGYEKYGLVKSSGKTDRGYLLYDRKAQERIREIRQYQSFGFQLKEICELFTATDAERKTALKHQRSFLLKRQSELQSVIDLISTEIDSLKEP